MYYWLENISTQRFSTDVDSPVIQEMNEKNYLTIFVGNLNKNDKVEADIKEQGKLTDINLKIITKDSQYTYAVRDNVRYDIDSIEKGRIGESIRYIRLPKLGKKEEKKISVEF
ncbi:MAG: hypothetical protein KatS3mg002_0239 [Candidatus Woesearchaeota archaeon]|nr:MAG: hypothetical protein KatS3mg002_0239 [Candidatus Woesearchaeota archaeon]